MKEHMYTYHYYRNRAVIRPQRTDDYILSSALLFAVAYLSFMLTRFF